MTKEQILMSCEKEIQQRLRRYDVVHLPENTAAREAEIELAYDRCKEKAKGGDREEPGHIYITDVLREMFGGFGDLYWQILTASRNVPLYYEKNVPETIRAVYLKATENLKVIYDGSWDLYMKDILRAVAYHEYLSDFKLNRTDLKSGPLFYDKTEYENIPIDLEVCVDEDIWCAFPAIGGGLLSEEYINNKDCMFKNIFKKGELEFDLSGGYKGKKEKGISYSILYNEGKNIIENLGPDADVWFFKNVLDPELFTSLYLAIGGVSIRRYDYNLIWSLCKCKCPSIRLYIFEAIKPCYLYIREIKNDLKRNYMEFLRERVDSTVRDINVKFESMVNLTALCLEKYSIRSKAIIAGLRGLDELFKNGDDFPLIFGSKGEAVKLGEKSEDEMIKGMITDVKKDGGDEGDKGEKNKVEQFENKTAKRYHEYMLRDVESSMNKIEYAVITALHEQWTRSEVEGSLEKDSNKVEEEFQDGFKSRLYWHIQEPFRCS